MTALDKLQGTLMLERGQFELHLFKGNTDIKTLKEIGRARVEAFSSYLPENVEEDLDEYDFDYYHIYLRDKVEKKVIGAYRLGHGSELIKTHGINGFYLSSLFELDQHGDFLAQSLELGRSFILPNYQKNYLSLLLLWKGVFHFFTAHQNLNFCIGPVSIPCEFDAESIEMIVDYLSDYQSTNSSLILGRQNYIPRRKWSFDSLKDLEIELQKRENYYPILLKKYLALNAEVKGFNIDPCFGNSIDVLISIDKTKIPERTVKCLTKAR